MPPATCAMMYGSRSLAGKRPPTNNPTETAGLRWQPEMWPTAYAMVRTVSPKARETPRRPMPTLGNAAASTALPHPPKTSHPVPMNSAVSRLRIPISGDSITVHSRQCTLAESMFDWNQNPHRRLNPLTGEWVLVSPHRTERPWQGQTEKDAAPSEPDYDPECYLCPGNLRAGGVRNPNYASTFVFDNDFATLKPATPAGHFERDGLLIAESETGICRVVCFSPRHNLTIAGMDPADLRKVVDTWVEQHGALAANPAINYVQIFENRGAMMGASNPHPHCQIWSSHALPNEVVKEQASQLAWREAVASFANTPGWSAPRANAWWRRTTASLQWSRSVPFGPSRRW